MLLSLIPSNWLSLHGLITVSSLLVYVVASHVRQQRRHPSAAIGWVLFMFLLPYVALPLYLLFGTRKLARATGRSRADARTISPSADSSAWPVELAVALGQPHPAPYRTLCVHADGSESLRALLELIDGARHTLDVCSFMLGRDPVGEAVISHLAAKARAGVRVRLLLDGVGRMLGGWPDLSPLVQAGVRVGFFAPLLHFNLRGRTNLRNHRKFAVADAGRVAERLWCGGRNLAAEYFEAKPGGAAWHDLSFDLQGPLARQAADLFQRDWVFAVGSEPSTTGAAAADAKSVALAAPDDASGQIIASGPDQADDTVHAMLVSAGYRARTRIALVSPYVLLDEALLMSLCLAARRGVEVDLLLPVRSNHRLADIARYRSLRALAAAGARVWFTPHMLHAKAAIIDDVLALAGSANLDSRSLFLNYELMAAFHDAGDIARFSAWFDRERRTASLYDARPPGLWRDLLEGLVLWIGFQL